MDYTDHISSCNHYDISGFTRFFVGDIPVGWIRHNLAIHLGGTEKLFEKKADGISFGVGLSHPSDRSGEMALVLTRLADQGVIPPLRNEDFPVSTHFGAELLMQMDRSAVPAFGLAAYGTHVNGFVRRENGGIDLWIGRRARDRRLYPGKLDNMVAGGLPVDLSPMANVIKEAEEEAGIHPELAACARQVSKISYVVETEDGLTPDTMFCFDLELPEEFVPENKDGEVEAFYCRPVEDVMETVRTGFDFKFNCNLVIIDFLLRHRLIPDSHPDFNRLTKGLRNSLNIVKTA